jgi:nucleoside phosphorylase
LHRAVERAWAPSESRLRFGNREESVQIALPYLLSGSPYFPTRTCRTSTPNDPKMSKRKREIGGNEEPVSSKTNRRKVDGKSHSTELTHNDYTVGWVCALPKEQTAATAMLDSRHADLLRPPNDLNTYTLGSVGKHNIVIACLPKGEVGTNPAATVAAWMISTFPSIKFGLMVGIGGGIPPKVRLGDVVVSTPIGQFPGVVQWDFGKAKQGGNFERTGVLNNPPSALLTAVTKLETEHELNGSKIPEHLNELKQKWPRLASKYIRSDSLQDILFKPECGHVNESPTDCAAIPDNDDGDEEGEGCRFCDRTQVVKRKPRDMRVHYGLIASSNQVIKDATFRDKLNKDLGGHVLCVEMEAAGLMNNFPCTVIRGICDYADSHKNDDWQEHAAAVAAAFAKELLAYIQPNDVEGERPVKDILGQG